VPTLRVRDWDENFENHRTRELKSLSWLPVPVKLDGDGYAELLDHPEGAAHFGAWIALLEVAAKCEIRGTFLRQSGTDLSRPHDLPALSRMTRIPLEILKMAVERLVDIGWLEWVENRADIAIPAAAESRADPAQIPRSSRALPAQHRDDPAPSRANPAPVLENSTGHKSTEEKEGRVRAGARGNPPKSQNRRSPKFDPYSVPLPEILDTPAFRQKWELRLKERTEPGRRGSPPSESSVRSQLAKLEQLAKLRGLPAAIACVERATDGRHQGIVFPEDFEAPRNGGGAAADGLPSQQPGLTHDQRRRRSGAPPDWREQLREREKDIVPWMAPDAFQPKG
jgi:hypothetical protein